MAQLEQMLEKMEAETKELEEQIAHYQRLADTFDDVGLYERKLIAASQQGGIDEPGLEYLAIELSEEEVLDSETEASKPANEQRSSRQNISDRWLNELKEHLTKWEDLMLFSQERQRLQERLTKYEQQSFMISLFGAFSAGKSSFANALLGEAILPVSPHPTTATVNIIKRAEQKHPHKTALIKVKSEERLKEEVAAIARQLDQPLTLEELPSWKPKMKEFLTSWQKNVR